jgi:hypothetical protein
MAMSNRVRFFRAVGLGGLLLLALAAAGCGRRDAKQADLERMAECLRTNLPYRPYDDPLPADKWPPGKPLPPRRTTGLRVHDRFWVDEQRSRKTTVGEMLRELGASLQGGKVIDATGRELYFYRVQNVHPKDPHPQNTEEEIEELEKHYHVIRMYAPVTD